MKILAFLQNPWFHEGISQRHIEMYRDDQDFHRRVLAMSMSGRRLQMAFGELYNDIHWDNTNWRPANHASGKEKPDLDHVMRILKSQDWSLILTFGNQAKNAITLLLNSRHKYYVKLNHTRANVLFCHHPNARHRTQVDLNNFASIIKELCAQTTPH